MCIDGSLARDEDGGRRRQWRLTRPDRGFKGSTAHDPADGNDSCYFESLIFSSQSSVHAVEYRTSELRRGLLWMAPRLTVMINCKGYYGRNCNPHFWFRRGYLVEVRACANGFLQVFPRRALRAPKGEWCFPTGRAISAEGRVAVHRGADHVELPRLARPKGCFDTSAEWS